MNTGSMRQYTGEMENKMVVMNEMEEGTLEERREREEREREMQQAEKERSITGIKLIDKERARPRRGRM